MNQQSAARQARRGLLAVSITMGVGLLAGSAHADAAINADADEILRSMSSFVAGAKSFSVDADTENEIIDHHGQKLQFNASSKFLVARPSRFQIVRDGMRGDATLVYDGAKLTIYSRKLNAYVQKDIPGTIDDAIVGLETEMGLDAPGADLLVSNPYAALSAGVVSSGYYGTGYVGGIECHHLAFRTPELDLQLWVQTGDEPLPMKYVITSKWITGAPQYSIQLSNWNLQLHISDQQLELSLPQGLQKRDALLVDEAGEIVGETGHMTSKDGK